MRTPPPCPGGGYQQAMHQHLFAAPTLAHANPYSISHPRLRKLDDAPEEDRHGAQPPDFAVLPAFPGVPA